MISSFHTHTYRCKHADGNPADYIQQAEKDGCSALGFSDHCPYPEDGIDWWPGIRMDSAEAPDYVDSVRAAGKKASFPVFCGFECEYDPIYNSWYHDYLKEELKTDYLVLGMHWVVSGKSHIYIANSECDRKLIHQYADQTCKGIESGLFAFVAHPDLCMNRRDFSWDDAEVRASLTSIIDCAVACNIPLEINGNGFARGLFTDISGKERHHYPVDEFWLLAKEKGARIICNSDAHSPSDVIRFARDVRDYAGTLGITPEEFHL